MTNRLRCTIGLHGLTSRLRDERGMALVMAIGISFVLAIAGASVILFTTSNERHANRQNATTKLYDIAQAGIDNAAAQLGGKDNVDNDVHLHDATFFDSMPAADKTATIDGGTVTWGGTMTDTTAPSFTWRLTATATMPDPTNPGNTLSRTLSADLPLTPHVQQVTGTQAWNYIYSRGNDGNPNTCDQTIMNNPAVTASFYVNGDLCLDNSSNIYGPQTGDPAVRVVVKGRAYLNHPSTSIGTSARPLTSIEVDGGCKYRSNPLHSPPTPCSAVDKVWPDSTWSGTTIDAPTATYALWWDEASPSPKNPCEQTSGTPPNLGTYSAGGPTGSAGIVDLTPGASYSCVQRGGGKLVWDYPTKTLTVQGTIWIDGSVDFSSDGVLDYDGMAAIYLTGSVRFRQTILCAEVNAAGDSCDPVWASSPWNVLLFVAKGTGTPALTGAGVTLEQSSGFQGALFSEGNMTFENNTWTQGPMIAQSEIITNSMYFNFIPTLVNVPFGAPGTPIWDYDLAPVRHYVG
jgi:Flp pilus assembly protein TadG